MKKITLLVFIGIPFLSIACRGNLPSVTPQATATPTFAPTATPGCIQTTALPTVQYSEPNPPPAATPFSTPVSPVVTSMSGFYTYDNQDHGGVLLKSSTDWTTYWNDQNLPVPTTPTDFVSKMVFIPGKYHFDQICYTTTNVVIYQSSAGGGAPPCLTCFPNVSPIPTPSTISGTYYVVPASSLPVSFASSFLNAL